MSDIIMLIALAGVIICIAGVLGHAADYFGRDKTEPYERKTKPFTSRHLQRDEIAHLVHQIAILDAIFPIGPANYHDSTQLNVEALVSEQLGRKFEISTTDWFHVVRAWHVTRGQELSERCERLELRLALNI